ncbi:hypothetical protein F5X96DRAFT_673867 [Biscogniauxia mediterranea]|nr:hypothetical protein F5X96DRAFT_673867 [Biscogniauxia mediterranea]
MASTTAVKTPVRASNNGPEDVAVVTQWKIYDTIMTPVNFITFIISLYLVDNRYQEQRARGGHHHHHREQHYLSKIVPVWLHALLFRPRPQLQPYEWVTNNTNTNTNTNNDNIGDTTTTTTTASTSTSTNNPTKLPRRPDGMRRTSRGEERWYYHTKQRKLLRMEAADAFELRNAVLLGLGLAALGLATLAWWAARMVGGWWMVGGLST